MKKDWPCIEWVVKPGLLDYYPFMYICVKLSILKSFFFRYKSFLFFFDHASESFINSIHLPKKNQLSLY